MFSVVSVVSVVSLVSVVSVVSVFLLFLLFLLFLFLLFLLFLFLFSVLQCLWSATLSLFQNVIFAMTELNLCNDFFWSMLLEAEILCHNIVLTILQLKSISNALRVFL